MSNLHDPLKTGRAWPENMADGDQIMVLLSRGYWTVGMLEDGRLVDFHEDRNEIGVPILYSDVLPVSTPTP
jgi:hypothetical protein